jgi:hypothetical protein
MDPIATRGSLAWFISEPNPNDANIVEIMAEISNMQEKRNGCSVVVRSEGKLDVILATDNMIQQAISVVLEDSIDRLRMDWNDLKATYKAWAADTAGQ